MNWYIILLSESDIAQGKRQLFIQRFKQLYESNNRPQASALFESRVEGDGWRGYFSSSNETVFAELVKEYLHCVSNNKPHPDREKLHWLAGDESWERVFVTPD